MPGRTREQKDIPEVNGARPQLGDIAPAVSKVAVEDRMVWSDLPGEALLDYLRG